MKQAYVTWAWPWGRPKVI